MRSRAPRSSIVILHHHIRHDRRLAWTSPRVVLSRWAFGVFHWRDVFGAAWRGPRRSQHRRRLFGRYTCQVGVMGLASRRGPDHSSQGFARSWCVAGDEKPAAVNNYGACLGRVVLAGRAGDSFTFSLRGGSSGGGCR